MKSVFLKNASGSTFLEISPTKLKSISISLPPLAEQISIAKILNKTDYWIDSLEKVIYKKRQIFQGIMQKMMLPQNDWKFKSLVEFTKIFTKQTGFDYSAYIKPALEKVRTSENIPFIQNKDFCNKWINFNTDYYIPKSTALKFPNIVLDEKCLLISISGSIGNIGLFDSKKLAFIGGAVAILKFHDTNYIDWVMYFLKSDFGQNKLLGNVKSGSHQNLILEDIRKIAIYFPPLAEQRRITTMLSELETEIVMLEKKFNKAKLLKQGIMQQLLTGKIRLTN